MVQPWFWIDPSNNLATSLGAALNSSVSNQTRHNVLSNLVQTCSYRTLQLYHRCKYVLLIENRNLLVHCLLPSKDSNRDTDLRSYRMLLFPTTTTTKHTQNSLLSVFTHVPKTREPNFRSVHPRVNSISGCLDLSDIIVAKPHFMKITTGQVTKSVQKVLYSAAAASTWSWP